MNFLRVHALLLILVFGLASCGASGPKFAAPAQRGPEKGLVYIYRVYELRGSAGSPNIYINGQKRDTLKTGGYLDYSLPPGEHLIFLGSKPGDFANWAPDPVEVRLRVDAGKIYYLRMLKDDSDVSAIYAPTVGVMAVGKSKIGLASVREDFALQELQDTKLSR